MESFDTSMKVSGNGLVEVLGDMQVGTGLIIGSGGGHVILWIRQTCSSKAS